MSRASDFHPLEVPVFTRGLPEGRGWTGLTPRTPRRTHLLGSTLGAVAAGLCVDLLTARGHADPLSKTIVGFLVLGTVVETTGYGFAAWRFMEDKKWVETVACDLR